MNKTIKNLLEITYNGGEANYSEVAYRILDKLNKNQLQEIIQIEDIYLSNKNGNIDYLKEEIYNNLVRFKNDRLVLGFEAAKNYWE